MKEMGSWKAAECFLYPFYPTVKLHTASFMTLRSTCRAARSGISVFWEIPHQKDKKDRNNLHLPLLAPASVVQNSLSATKSSCRGETINSLDPFLRCPKPIRSLFIHKRG